VSKITNIKVLGLALFAVFAFSMVAAATAFAENEWLFNGAPIGVGSELATNTVGTLTLGVLDETKTVEVNTIVCSALFEGTVGAGSVDLVLDLFDLAGNLIQELSGTSLTCETLFDLEGAAGCTVGAESLLWVDELSLTLGLTWESLIELSGTTFLDHFASVAFELKCLLLNGFTLESLCSGLTSGTLTNVVPNVLLEFGAAAGTEELNCTNTVGGMAAPLTFADLSGDLVIAHATGGTLAVS
jgi:hypothetical protein